MNLILTTLNGELIITDEDKRYKANFNRMEQALTHKKTLQEAVDGGHGLLNDWTPITPEEYGYGWGVVLDIAEGEIVLEKSHLEILLDTIKDQSEKLNLELDHYTMDGVKGVVQLLFKRKSGHSYIVWTAYKKHSYSIFFNGSYDLTREEGIEEMQRR